MQTTRPSVQFNAVCRYGSSLGVCRLKSRRQKGSCGAGRGEGIKGRMASTQGMVSISTTTFRQGISFQIIETTPSTCFQEFFKNSLQMDVIVLRPHPLVIHFLK